MSRPSSHAGGSSSFQARKPPSSRTQPPTTADVNTTTAPAASSSKSSILASNPTTKKRRFSGASALMQSSTAVQTAAIRSAPNSIQASKPVQTESSFRANKSTVAAGAPRPDNGRRTAAPSDDDDGITMCSHATVVQQARERQENLLKMSSATSSAASKSRALSTSTHAPGNREHPHVTWRPNVFVVHFNLAVENQFPRQPGPSKMLPPPTPFIPVPPLSKRFSPVPPPSNQFSPLLKPENSRPASVASNPGSHPLSSAAPASTPVNAKTSSAPVPAIDEITDQLRQIQKSLINLENSNKSLVDDTKLIKSTLDKLTSATLPPASMPSDASWIDFSTALIYDLCQVPYGSPPPSLSKSVFTPDKALRPQWEEGPRSNLNKLWSSTFHDAFFNCRPAFIQERAITAEQLRNVSTLTIEQYRVAAFNIIRKSMGFGRQKSKLLGPAVPDAEDGDVSDCGPESEQDEDNIPPEDAKSAQQGVDALAERRLELAELRYRSCESDKDLAQILPSRILASVFDEGIQSDSLSLSEGEGTFAIRRPVWNSRKLIHFKSMIVDGLVNERLRKQGDQPLRRQWNNNWTLDDGSLAEGSGVEGWMVSRGWRQANPDLARVVVTQERESDGEAMGYLDQLLKQHGYVSDSEESLLEYSNRVEFVTQPQ
ncbi:hypothetical protein FRC00_009158 [Tulasnella sp. 408]|nr:hypothetical protein FRC00_009158 [Tulasnella sp. 408]